MLNDKQTHSEQTGNKIKTDLAEIMQKVEEPRLPERAYHILRTAIKNLVLAPGKTFLEREIAEMLDMSRTPIREALVRLQTESMITLVPRKGFVIFPIKKEDLREIYEITESLDGLAVELATNKITTEKLTHLQKLINQQEEALHVHDLHKWSVLDDQFHADLITYAENARLHNVMNTHADQQYRARLYTINDRPAPYQSITEHKAIITCMEAGDGKAARQMMQSHRKRAWVEIKKALEEKGSDYE